MKKLLLRIMAALLGLILLLTLVSDLFDFSAGIPIVAAIALLLIVGVIYTIRYGGVCCPNCEIRISGKTLQRLTRDGCAPCPRCGALIER